jgi:hypothetical protein
MKVQEAITEVMAKVGHVGKDSTNAQQHFNFRGIDAVVNALSPAMREVGLTVRPSKIVSIDREHFKSKSGADGLAVFVVVQYTLTGPEGDELVAEVAAEANDYGDKATPKVMSVAFRTFLLQTFALPTDEPDPDSQSYDRDSETQSNRPAPMPPERLQWFTDHVAKLTPEWQEKLNDRWQEYTLPAIKDLDPAQAKIASGLILRALEKQNATPMVMEDTRTGIPQPGFMGVGPDGQHPYYQGADQ